VRGRPLPIQDEDSGDAAASTRDGSTGATPPPAARPRSVWAEMVVGTVEDREPGGPATAPPAASAEARGEPAGQQDEAGRPGERAVPGGDEARWPASGLPPQFGQHAAVPEQVPEQAEEPARAGRQAAPLSEETASPEEPEAARPRPGPPGRPAGPGAYYAPGAYGPPEEYATSLTYGPPPGYVPPRPVFPPRWQGEPPARAGQPGRWAGPPPEAEPDTAPPRAAPPRSQPQNADSLTADFLLPGRHTPPASGWRRALYQATGGHVRAPQSAAERRREELILRANTPVAGGHHRVAVLSLKGGVGKTTTTVGLGATLASLRGDRVIAVDANPDRGTLCDKLRLETAATVRDLLNERAQIRRYADVRAYTTQAPSRLEVLASDRDPTVSVAFSAQDYEDVARVLGHYYSICVTDCGTGLLHSAMAGVLHLADQIVLVSSPSVDGARSASATLDWLAAHNYGDLVRSAVVVLSAVRPRGKTSVDLGRLEEHFGGRCRAVVRVPYDAHLAEGAEVDLGRLSRATADAYLALAAEVGDGFAWPRARPPQPA
jgi:MinD-like ATPase involved in chromosome partitioning or flagellar assembly